MSPSTGDWKFNFITRLWLTSSPDDYSVLTAKQSPFSLKKTGPGNVLQTILTPTYSAIRKLNFGQSGIWTHDLGMDFRLLCRWATRPKRKKKWMLCRSLFSCILLIQNHTANGGYSWFLYSTWYMQLAKTFRNFLANCCTCWCIYLWLQFLCKYLFIITKNCSGGCFMTSLFTLFYLAQ